MQPSDQDLLTIVKMNYMIDLLSGIDPTEASLDKIIRELEWFHDGTSSDLATMWENAKTETRIELVASGIPMDIAAVDVKLAEWVYLEEGTKPGVHYPITGGFDPRRIEDERSDALLDAMGR